ncbi:AAA family ATPase [Brachyspira hyodysenteriae]|nr:AAA family ATPase [Brachyspira hyodysenteriae]MDA1468377.1 AAA family ATPase [Brachyspira hyodysenteriae]
MSDIQIPNISISNFKCFKEFSIDCFKRFNLIFGKNSVGKSNLLKHYIYTQICLEVIQYYLLAKGYTSK